MCIAKIVTIHEKQQKIMKTGKTYGLDFDDPEQVHNKLINAEENKEMVKKYEALQQTLEGGCKRYNKMVSRHKTDIHKQGNYAAFISQKRK